MVIVKDHVDLTQDEELIFMLLDGVVRHFSLKTQLRVAGPWVRDKLLGKHCNNIDIVLDNLSGSEFCEKVSQFFSDAGCTAQELGIFQCSSEHPRHLNTGRMVMYDIWINISNLRSKGYSESEEDARFGTPQEDAWRRDLTINSLFYNIDADVIEDFTGKGITDLKSGRIVTPLPPKQTFLDDPLKVLRAIRFGAQFGFELDEELKTAASGKEVVAAVQGKIKRKRVGHEINRMVSGNQPGKAMGHVSELQLFSAVFSLPEMIEPSVSDGYERLCVDHMDSASKLLAAIEGSFTEDQLRLCLYGALFLPLRGNVYSEKGEEFPVVNYLLCHSLKRMASDAEIVTSLHIAAKRFLSLIPYITSNDDTKSIEVDWSSASKLEALVRLLLRDIKDYWRPALVLCMLLHSVDSESFPRSELEKQKDSEYVPSSELDKQKDSESVGRSELDKQKELYKMVEDWISGKGLVKVWKPLVKYRSRLRIFKWDAKVIPDDEECTPAILVSLIRSSIRGAATPPEVIAIPYSIRDVPDKTLRDFSFETMKRLPMLASVENLDELATDFSGFELFLKFGLRVPNLLRFCCRFLQNDPGRVLVLFIDVQIKPYCEEPENAYFISQPIDNTEVDLYRAEEIEEYLKVFPGMVVEGARGMEEVTGRMEFSRGKKMKQLQDCPICLVGIRPGELHATTYCSHIFHRSCLGRWVLEADYETCPYCRSSLQADQDYAFFGGRGICCCGVCF